MACTIMHYLEALQAKMGTLSLEAQNKLEEDTAKKEAKAEAKADAAKKKKMVYSYGYYVFAPTDLKQPGRRHR